MSASYQEYQKRYDDETDGKKLIRLFWEISEFSEKDLITRLWRLTDLDEDIEESEIGEDTDFYSDFLSRSNLFKAGLDLLGVSAAKESQLDGILNAQSDLPEMVSAIRAQLDPEGPEYLKLLRDKDDDFDWLRAEAVLFLVRSKDFLQQWSRDFSRIAGQHPCWLLPVRNVLSLTFRGEAQIVNSNAMTHRGFDDCAEKFTALTTEDTLAVWSLKRLRIERALEGM